MRAGRRLRASVFIVLHCIELHCASGSPALQCCFMQCSAQSYSAVLACQC